MRPVLLALVGVVALVVVLFAALGWWSQRTAPAAPGLLNGVLAPCGPAPHCVCSESGDSADRVHRVEPIALPPQADALRWRVLREVIAMQGGNVERQAEGYLHASFESALFGFVDDVEFRLDGALLQVRSSSRVGYSDLGANRKRVEALRAALTEAFAAAAQ